MYNLLDTHVFLWMSGYACTPSNHVELAWCLHYTHHAQFL